MTCVLRCKSVHKMATGKSDDQSIQLDNKLELGTSYKLKLGPRWELGQEVANHNSGLNMIAWWQSMTRTPMTTSMIAWYCTMRTPMTTWPFALTSTLSERSAHCSVSSCVLARHISHTHRGSSNEFFIPSTCPCSCERFSSSCSHLSISRTSCRTPSLSSCTWSS